MTLQPLHIIEVVTRVTPFGVRFYDAAIQHYVSNLNVTACPDAQPSRQFKLFANPSGVFVMKGLPGLHDFEYGAGDADFWAHVPPAKGYRLTVSDPEQRYLPFTFPANVPTEGVFRWMCGPQASPLDTSAPDVPLFSSPSRHIPAGMIAVRADLRWQDAASGERPAAWAMIEVSYEGARLGYGLADRRGSTAVLIPYPQPVDLVPLSPFETGIAPWEQQWPLDFSVAFVPGLSSPAEDGEPFPEIPDLCEVMQQLEQPRATAWANTTRTVAISQGMLKFGQELILRSAEAGTDKPLSVLHITPAP